MNGRLRFFVLYSGLTFLMVSSAAAVEPGQLSWAVRAGGSAWDSGWDIAMFEDGSVVITGMLEGVATFGLGEPNETTITPTGTSDTHFAKFNPNGTLAWAIQVVGTDAGEQDQGIAVAAVGGGGFLAIGNFPGTATFGLGEPNETTLVSASANLRDIFVAKYNSDGSLIWATRAGGASTDEGRGVAPLSDGGAIITGWFRSFATFGPGEVNETVLFSPNGVPDMFVARLNSDGTLAWAKRAGGNDQDRGSRILALPDDSALVVGSFGFPSSGSATFGQGEPNETVLNSSGGTEIFIAKFNPDGTLAWAKRAGGSQGDAPYSAAALPDGGAVVTGYYGAPSGGVATFGEGEVNETTLTSVAGGQDIFVARYSPAGTLDWVRSAGSSGNENGSAIAVLPDGSALVTGDFGAPSGSSVTFGPGEPNETILSSAGGADIFVAQFDPGGSLVWATRAGGSGSDFGYGIGADPEGNALVSGGFAGTALFGSGEVNETSLSSAGLQDLFVAKYIGGSPGGVIEALIDVDPDTLNLKSHGQWITVYITLPQAYDVNNIDLSTIAINSLIGNSCDPEYTQVSDTNFTPQVGDRDEDLIPDLTVKFDRQLLISNLCVDDVSIQIEGDLTTGEHFVGTDSIRVIDRGK